MDEAQPWEEALDLDDSNLPPPRPSKRLNHRPDLPAAAAQPFLRHCSQTLPSQNPQNPPSQAQPQPSVSPRLIPGPAGTVQAVMLRRRKNPNDQIVRGDFGEELIATQEYIRRAIEDGVEDDDDFFRDPWLSGEDYIRQQGLADSNGVIGIPLSAIKSKFNMDKVAQVVAILKSCTSNGLGGMMLTLKDPTGTIAATIHGRVLTKGGIGKDLSIGAVMILREVAVFSPSRSAHYLNITSSNIVKVISKDGGVPLKQLCSVTHGIPINEHYEKSQMPQKPISLTLEEVMGSLRQNAFTKGNLYNDERVERSSTTNSCLGDRNNHHQNAASGKEQFMAHVLDNGPKEVPNGTDKEKNEEVIQHEQQHNKNPQTHAVGGNILECAPSAASTLTSGISDKRSGDANGSKWRQPTNSSVSLLEWTDEQLDELFDFD